MLNVKDIKKDFPIFKRKIDGKELVYLDSAATSQKPQVVIDAVSDFYQNTNANVHRGLYALSEEATDLYEKARKKTADFIGAQKASEIVFTKGATESLNRVAFGWAENNLQKGDVILVVEADHHSNVVPWQIVAQKTGVELKVVPVDNNGLLDLDLIKKELKNGVKLVSISHASNVLGTIFPVKEVCSLAKEADAVVSIDGAQAVPHTKVNVQSIGCDFYSFSSHKMLGPMGIGVLWAKSERLKEMEPYEYGGGMIKEVEMKQATWAEIPQRFEAGTPNVVGAVGLSTAIDYLQKIGYENIKEHELELTKYALEELSKIDGLKILGPKDAGQRTSLVSFTIDGMHSHDIAAVLSEYGIAVRSGQHCTMPLHKKFDITSSVRASMYIYNTKDDTDMLIEGIKKAKGILT